MPARRPAPVEDAKFNPAAKIDRVLNWLRDILWRKYCVEFAWRQVINEDAVFDKATGLTFSTLFTLLALVLLLVYLTPQIAPLRQNQEAMLDSTVSLLIPGADAHHEVMEWLDGVKRSLTKELEGKPSALLMVVGLFASLAIFVRGVDRNFNMIWRGEELTRSLGQYIVDAVILIVVTVLVLPLTLNLKALMGPSVPDFLTWIFDLVPYALGVVAFTILFYTLPIDDDKGFKHLKAAFFGSCITVAGLVITLWFFGVFHRLLFPRFQLYLVLQSLLLFLMTIYTLWVVILAGLELTRLFKEAGPLQSRSTLPDVYLGVAVLFYLQERYANPERGQPVSLSELVSTLELPDKQTRLVLDRLEAKKLVHALEGGRYIPAHRLARMTLKEVVYELGGDFSQRLRNLPAAFEHPDYVRRIERWIKGMELSQEMNAGLSFELPKDFRELDVIRESRRAAVVESALEYSRRENEQAIEAADAEEPPAESETLLSAADAFAPFAQPALAGSSEGSDEPSPGAADLDGESLSTEAQAATRRRTRKKV